jgi:hypothetical protein
MPLYCPTGTCLEVVLIVLGLLGKVEPCSWGDQQHLRQADLVLVDEVLVALVHILGLVFVELADPVVLGCLAGTVELAAMADLEQIDVVELAGLVADLAGIVVLAGTVEAGALVVLAEMVDQELADLAGIVEAAELAGIAEGVEFVDLHTFAELADPAASGHLDSAKERVRWPPQMPSGHVCADEKL